MENALLISFPLYLTFAISQSLQCPCIILSWGLSQFPKPTITCLLSLCDFLLVSLCRKLSKVFCLWLGSHYLLHNFFLPPWVFHVGILPAFRRNVSIDHVINAAKNIYMLLEKMIQKERPPEPFFHLKINGFRNNFMP